MILYYENVVKDGKMDTLKLRYGPVALVTGASSGIGSAFAEELAARGFGLVLVARRGDRLEKIKKDLEHRFGVTALIIVQDLTAPRAARRIRETVQKSGWEISLLINNAGFGSQGEFDQLNLDNELNMVDLACRVPVELTHGFIQGMKERRRGGIIFVSSVLSQFPSPYMATYAAGKAFEFSFANSLHGEGKAHGIDVLALLPGTTDTEFFQVAKSHRRISMPKADPRAVARTALRALGKKPYVVHGWTNKISVFMSRYLLTRWLIGLVRLYMKPKSR